MALLDLSARITKAAKIPKLRHKGAGRAVDVLLTSAIVADDTLDVKKIGLNRVTAAWVLVPLTGTTQVPVLPAVASGSTVRFIGS